MSAEAIKGIILGLLKEKHESSGGHNGYNLIQLRDLSGLDLDQIAQALNELHREDRILVNNTINHVIARWKSTVKTLLED